MTKRRAGQWWLSTDPDRRVPGELTLTDGEWTLTTVGELEPIKRNEEPGFRIESKTILGLTTDGPVSLWGCRWIHQTSGRSSGVAQERQHAQAWQAGQLIVGRTIDLNYRFNAASVAIEGLTEWWEAGAHRVRLGGSSDADLDEVNAGRRPATIVLQDGWNVTLGSGSTETIGSHRSSYERHTYVHVERPGGFTHEELYQRIIFPLRAMLGMTFHTRIQIESEQLRPTDPWDEHEMLTVDPGKLQTPIEAARWPLLRDQALFTAANVNPVTFLQKWFGLSEALVIPLGFLLLDNDRRPLQLSVLDVVSAAETLHRALHQDEVDLGTIDRIMAVLKADGFNAQDRHQARSALKLGYGPKLSSRLADLVDELETPVKNYLLGGEIAAWSNVVGAIRNALSHGLQTEHRLHEDIPAMLAVFETTRLVLELRLSVACGLVTGERLERHLRRIRRYEGVAHQRLVSWPELQARLRT
jgi:ApeA N-terminal domain 1